MCATCGCSSHPEPEPQHGHHHDHSHPHDHDHHHDHAHDVPHEHHRPEPRLVALELEVLAKNRLAAERNRGWLAGREVTAVNLMSAPGAGKTTLLERTIRDLQGTPIAVIEGDQETLRDAERIRAAGAPVVQLNTGTGCHLDAPMVAGGLATLAPARGTIVMIENVGNLVCPALFDLGEAAKVVLMSVTEGEDKPLKYPHMFRAADLLVLTKVDLLPHLDFALDRCLEWARRVNDRMEILQVSATRGTGLDAWYGWLRNVAAAAPDAFAP